MRLTTTHRRSDEPIRRSDRGFTMIEAVVTIALTASIVVALLAAVRTSVKASSTIYTAAQVETTLINAADRVGRAPQRCEYDEYVEAAAVAAGWPTTSAHADVELLVGNTGDPVADWAPQACPDAVGPFDVQRLTIRVTSPDDAISRTITVVKGNVN
jgi:type II secretory pathway pseudopilin PulG